jgi:hypothetical protein
MDVGCSPMRIVAKAEIALASPWRKERISVSRDLLVGFDFDNRRVKIRLYNCGCSRFVIFIRRIQINFPEVWCEF